MRVRSPEPPVRRSEVPEWRRRAAAGVSLAAAMPKERALTRAAAVNGGQALALRRILRPEAQGRWLLPSLAVITPQYIEAILRGALTGNHVFQWQLFDLMEDTWPRLVKNLNELKRSAITELLQRWELRAWAPKAEAPPPEAVDRSGLAEEGLAFMGNAAKNQNGYEETLYDILDAWAKGASLLEILYDTKEGSKGQMIAPTGTVWVHPRNYAWGSSGELGLVLPESEQYGAGTAQRMGQQTNLEELTEDKFICAICRARSGHPLGGALLRPLAWWWAAQNFSADWLLNFAQIFGLPIRWANYDPAAEKDTIDAICDMLENMGAAGWGAFPAGTTIGLKEASKGGSELPQATMADRCDKQCDLLILGQTLTTEVSKEGGSRALGEVHYDVRSEVIHAAARFLAAVVNEQVIKPILRLNYGDDDMAPRLVPPEEDPEAAKTNAEVLQLAVEMGVPVPVNFALEKLNIRKAEEGEEVLKTSNFKLQTPGNDQTPSSNGNGELLNQARRAGGGCVLHARDEAMAKLVDNVVEDLTGVEAKWLGGVKPFFRELVLKARDENVSDADFLKVLERAQREMPELFAKLDADAVAGALEGAMGAACVNGAVRGWMERRPA